MWYSVFKHGLVRPLVKWGYRGRVEGAGNIPATGGVVLASNHISAIDTVVLPSLIRRPVTFPAKAELFAGDRGTKSRVLAWFLKAVGQVPLDRSGARASLDGLGPILTVLEVGGIAGIYPEGTRSPDGRLQKPKAGVGLMACKTGVPVVPCRVFDSFQAFGKGRLIPHFGTPVTIVFGPPIPARDYDDPTAGKARYETAAQRIMDRIAALPRPHYAVI